MVVNDYQFHDLPSILLGYGAYALVSFIYVIWLRHLYGPRTQRLGWLLLVGQLLILTMHGWPIGPHTWWNHDAEGNIPVAFATFQVLLGSFCALLLAIHSTTKPRWLRGYWALLSLGLYVLAVDEFGYLHDRFPIIEEFYLIGGVCVALLSVPVWRNLKEQNRHYMLLLVTGLGISVAGAEILDKKGWLCADFLQVFSLDCMRLHPLEETFEKLGAFFVVMAVLGWVGKTVSLERWQRARRSLIISFSLPTLGLLTVLTIVNIRSGVFESNFVISETFFHQTDFANGYRLDATVFPNTGMHGSGQHMLVTIFGKMHREIEQDFGYAIHFVDQVSEEVYTAHEHWSRYTAEQWREKRRLGDRQKIWVPEHVPAGRALWLVFSLWEQNEDGDFTTIPISSSDQFLLSDTQIVLRDFVLRDYTLAESVETGRDFQFGDGFMLRVTDVPQSAIAGETLVIPFTWQADSEGREDWVQFLHFVHEETGALWNHDQQPLGARLPTRLWYEGLTGHRNLANHAYQRI